MKRRTAALVHGEQWTVLFFNSALVDRDRASWRRGDDSNVRSGRRTAEMTLRSIQPLSHLSTAIIARFHLRMRGGHLRIGFRQIIKDQRLANELSDIAHFQTPHEIEPMDFDGLNANLQLFADFAARIPFRD